MHPSGGFGIAGLRPLHTRSLHSVWNSIVPPRSTPETVPWGLVGTLLNQAICCKTKPQEYFFRNFFIFQSNHTHTLDKFSDLEKIFKSILFLHFVMYSDVFF
jgi:hypothetical protein